MSSPQHWQSVYAAKAPEALTWYQPHLARSLAFLAELELPPDARIVDVGGGASTLVDDLLDRGFSNLAVVDLAEAALTASRARLGARAAGVDWVVGDARTPLLGGGSVDLWHDRAVFHFLGSEPDRAAYCAQATRCVRPGGHLLVATFAPDGPERCSGLPVVRYDPAGLAAAFGPGWTLAGSAREAHHTPAGGTQSFAYALLRRNVAQA